MGARMRQHRIGRQPYQAPHGDDVEIQCAGRISHAPLASGGLLYPLQKRQQFSRIHLPAEMRNAIYIGRLAGRRDRIAFVPLRQTNQSKPRYIGKSNYCVSGCDNRFLTVQRRQICAYSDH